MINPYESVNWETDFQVVSVSHEHCETQEEFDIFIQGDAEHIAFSNYYPSEPAYPLSDKFQNIPIGTLASPNAEQHSFNVNALHLNSLGSFLTNEDGYGGKPWQNGVKDALADLQYEDGGGVTINHPTWTNLSIEKAKQILDFDSRVLGIEIYNQSCELTNDTGWALEMWDSLLLTGRRCWGFAVPDHAGQSLTSWKGRNVLLVPTKSEYECLKAYRDGRFYTRLKNDSLAFASITLDANNVLRVSAPLATSIKIVVNGNPTDYTASEASQSIPTNATYCRVEAHNSDNSIFSNPIMINEKTYRYIGGDNQTLKLLLGLI